MKLRTKSLVVGIAVLAASSWLVFGMPDQRRGDLWRVVHDLCVRDARWLRAPAPCVDVRPREGFALLRGFGAGDELLLVPTARISGIEDPLLLAPATPDYWRLAWNERRRLLGGAVPLPREMVGLAVNSAYARTQDQLHIHIDCLLPHVQAMLASHAANLGPGWTRLELLPRQVYEVMALPAAALDRQSPFAILARAVGGTPAAMARQTLVLAGARRPDGAAGFYLLRQAHDPATGADGHGEALLDDHCSALTGHAITARSAARNFGDTILNYSQVSFGSFGDTEFRGHNTTRSFGDTILN